MTWSKTMTSTIAVPRGKPVTAEIRWCMAESVWRFAAEKDLVVESFGEVDPRRDVPVSAARKLGAQSPDEFDWHVFEAVLTRA